MTYIKRAPSDAAAIDLHQNLAMRRTCMECFGAASHAGPDQIGSSCFAARRRSYKSDTRRMAETAPASATLMK